MKISKIKGTIEEKTHGDHAIIRVWSFKESNAYFSEYDDIVHEFNEKMSIFSPKFFVRHSNFNVGDLIEISISDIDYKDNDDSLPSVKDTNCTKTGFRIIGLPINAFVSENSLNLDALSSDINTSDDIYFDNEEFLFGPFKKENQGFKPKIGKEVGKFKNVNDNIITSEYKSYILDAPKDKLADIDCMTASQSSEFLKEKLKNFHEVDFVNLKKQIEKIELNGLEKDRLEKAKLYINHVELNYAIIKNLIENNEQFRQIFEKTVENCRNEIKEEYKKDVIKPLEERRDQIQKEIYSKKEEKEKTENQERKIKKSLDPLIKEYKHLENERERLIQDIKAHALITPQNTENQVSKKLYTFEMQDFSRDVEIFNDLTDFRKIIGDIENNSLARRSFDLLKDYKCLLSNDIEMILVLAKATNNCKVLIQQVEPDWLKFEHFYENGLKQIWQAAHQEPDKIHFLLLQDLNMASIECYGRPVLDLLADVRVNLPIENTPLPKNLWIFGFPIALDEDDNFGLPLIKKTFKYWGGLPQTTENRIINDIESENLLLVEQISNNNTLPSNYLIDYFK
jgi:hypothetical protein